MYAPTLKSCTEWVEREKGEENNARGEGKKHNIQTMLLREYNVGLGKNLSNIKNSKH